MPDTYKEGDILQNDQGQKIVLRNNQWMPVPKAGAIQRGVTSLAGVPEETSINPISKDFYAGTGDLGNYIAALKRAITGLNPIPASTDAATTAMARMKKPGITNKVTGAVEYPISGIPYVGPMATHAMEQGAEGDIAGSVGSSVGAGLAGTGLVKGAPAIAEGSARLLNKPSVAKIPGFESIAGIGETAEQLEREQSQSRLAKIKEENAKTLREAQQKVKEANDQAIASTGAKQQSNKVALSSARNNYERTVAAVAQRESMVEEAKRAVQPLAEALPTIREQAKAVASSLYPDITGTRDMDTIREGIQSQIDDHLKGSGRVPTVLADAIKDLTPKESGGRALTASEEKASILAKKLLDQNVPHEDVRAILQNQGYLPKQINAIMEVARGAAGAVDDAALSFEKLHGIYSELGAASFGDIPGDEKAAINGARDYIGGVMRGMAEAENKGGRFEQAQKNWANLINTFYNADPLARGGSPIARALRALDPITKKLRPEFVQDALSGESEYKYARRMLAKYPELQRALDKMHFATEQAEKLPKQAPASLVKTGIKQVNPAELEPIPTAKDVPQQPEDEFDRLKWRLDTLREKAKQLSGMSRYEVNQYGFKGVPFKRTLASILSSPEMRKFIANSPTAMKSLANAGLLDLALVPRPVPGEENK